MTLSSNHALRVELSDINDQLENAHLMLQSLAESACAATTAEALPDNYDAGIDMLFRHALGTMMQAMSRNRKMENEVFALLRDERLPPAPGNRPMVIRDQFIAQCARDGVAVNDISQALGLSATAVQRAIRRLMGSEPEDQAAAG